jgi:hypothetical protein
VEEEKENEKEETAKEDVERRGGNRSKSRRKREVTGIREINQVKQKGFTIHEPTASIK